MADSVAISIRLQGMDDLNKKMDLLIREVHVLNNLLRQSMKLEQQGDAAMAMSMDDLQAKINEAITEVTQNTDAVASASALMTTLSQQLSDALASNPTDATAQVAAVQSVIDGLNANNEALANAVVANTPASTATTPPGE